VNETVRDTWAWLRELDVAGEATPQRADRPAVGLPPDLEAAALRAAATD
jgi:hypothetical protein